MSAQNPTDLQQDYGLPSRRGQVASRVGKGDEYYVSLARWDRDGDSIARLRLRVFSAMGALTPHCESDEIDADENHCRHAVVRDRDGVIVASARLEWQDGSAKVSRVTIRDDWRGRGTRAALLVLLNDVAQVTGVVLDLSPNH